MRKITSVEELMEAIEDSGYFGLRQATEHDMELIERGRDYLDCSYNWIDNVQTDELLPGTCGIGINEYMDAETILDRCNQVNDYMPEGGAVLLIHDGGCEYGNDENEVILGHDGYGADVIAIVDIAE